MTDLLEKYKADLFRCRGLNQSSFNEKNAYKYYKDEILINIGAGSFTHPKWVNVDVASEHYSAIQNNFVEYDITKESPLPFSSNSVKLAYTSHTIEHVKDSNVENMFSEVFRTLTLGGVFRVTCPDADVLYYAAKRNDMSRFFYRKKQWFTNHNILEGDITNIDYLRMGLATGLIPEKLIKENSSFCSELESNFNTLNKTDFLNYLCSQVDFSIHDIAQHINWWNYEKLKNMLQKVGFGHIRTSTYGGSLAAPMCNTNLFDNTMHDESVYIEAYK